MPKTIFGTTEKSNFILNLDLDRYRAFCAKLLIWVLWATGAAMAINQMTFTFNSRLNDMMHGGGFASVLSFCLIGLRSVAMIFSIGGVLVMIASVVGLMRMQWTKRTAPAYIMIAASLAWAVYSYLHSFDYKTSLFGLDGRDEGWFSLLMYGGFFFLGSMLRRDQNKEKLIGGILAFGIAQCVWGLLQAQPFFSFPNEYKLLEPISVQNLLLPCGLTDSPITFAMMLALLMAVSVPAAVCAENKTNRILGMVCAGGLMLLVFKTQCVAGLIAGIGGLLFGLGFCAVKRKQSKSKAWITPAVLLGAAALSFCWVYFSPSINGTFRTYEDNKTLDNGFVLYDGGIIWDDSAFRLSTSGRYSKQYAENLDIDDPVSVYSYCWGEGLRVTGLYPLEGTGPDNFCFTQLHTSMTLASNLNNIDRPYNEVLFIAATRGIIAAVLHIVLIGFCLILAWKRRKQHGSWMTAAGAGAAVLYLLCSMVGISVLTVAPLFWLLLGTVAAEPVTDK